MGPTAKQFVTSIMEVKPTADTTLKYTTGASAVTQGHSLSEEPDAVREKFGSLPPFPDVEILQIVMDRVGEPHYRVDLRFEDTLSLQLADFDNQNVLSEASENHQDGPTVKPVRTIGGFGDHAWAAVQLCGRNPASRVMGG